MRCWPASCTPRIAELELLLGEAQPPERPRRHSALPTYAVLDSAPVALYHVDHPRRRDIDYSNAEYRRIFGLAPIRAPMSGRRACTRKIARASRPPGPTFVAQPRPMASNTAPCPGTARCASMPSMWLPLRERRLRRHDQRFHRPRHGARRACTKPRPCSAIPSIRRPSASLSRTAAALPALQRRVLHPARLRSCASSPAVAVRISRTPRTSRSPPRSSSGLWTGEVPFLDFEKRYRRKDGSFMWVRTTTALVRDGSSAECSVEYLRDITQRQGSSPPQLLQQRTLLEAVISDLPVALLACDVVGKDHSLQSRGGGAAWHAARRAGIRRDSDLARGGYVSHGRRHPCRRGRSAPWLARLRGETISNFELTVVPREAPPRTTLSSARRLARAGRPDARARWP